MNAPARQPMLPVVWRQRHFVGAPQRRDFDLSVWSPTIGQIVDSIPASELPRGFAELGEARINGELVPRGLWHLVRPKQRPGFDTVVTLHVPLHDHGSSGSSSGGGKSTIALVASIAVLLVASVLSAGSFGLLGASFAAGTFGAWAAAAAVGIGGALAISALTPRPSLSNLTTASPASGATAAPATASAASLTGNLLQPGGSVPRVVGTMRLFPPLACNPLIEVVGDVEYGEAVFVLAGPHALSASQVGGTASTGIAELVEQLVEGKPGDAIQTLVQRYSYTNDVNAQLGQHTLDPTTQYYLLDQGSPGADVPTPTPCVGRDSPDEIWINLAWTQGLFSNTAVGSPINQAVRVQIRRRGSDPWINLPEVHFSMNVATAFQKVIRVKWGLKPAGIIPPPTNQGPVFAFKNVPGQNGSTVTPATLTWTADPSFSAGSGNDLLYAGNVATTNVLNTELYPDKVIFYLDPTVFPQDYYEIQVTAGSPYNQSNFSAVPYTYSGAGLDFFNYYLSGSPAVARIPEDQSSISGAVQLTRLSSVWNDNPIQSYDFATMSIKVHSRALSQYSILASGYTYDWDGSGWNTFTTTSNPAPHARDVLAGLLGAKPVPPSLISDAEFVAWRTDSIARSLTVNSVVEGKKIVDVLNMITGCTRAAIRHNEKWGVFLDRDRSADAPVQIFSPRNMANFVWTRAYADNPSGILANYVDADNDYDTSAEDIVYANDAVQNADLLQQQTYDGLVHKTDIENQARFDLGQVQYRFTFYSFDCGADSIVCQRGDLIGVQHDTLTRRAGSSRILSVAIDGSGNITGLTLDGTVPVWTSAGIQTLSSVAAAASVQLLGEKTGIAIRLNQGAGILVKQITAAANDDVVIVTFATPFPDPGNLNPDCLVTVGPLGSEYIRLIVYGVQPKADMQATVTCVDEAPQLWS
jgi:hypothetical protein